MIFCRAGLTSLDTCLPDAFGFLPLDFFSAASGGLPNLSIEYKSVKVWPVPAAKRALPSSLILSFWAFKAVMMETFLNSLSESFGRSDRLQAIRLFKNLISSGVQAAYLILSRAVLSLASSGVCVLCLIFFLSITTVVT